MKRVTLFCGHYGSGKTNLAVNYSFYLKSKGLDVAIADLDIVNPYFRTKDSETELREKGIEVISLPFANSSVDLPSLPSQSYSLFQNKNRYAVLDIGGDDAGAFALGRFRHMIIEEDNFENLFVVNFCRPLTPDAKSALEIMAEIEKASGVPFTGIANNTNLGEETEKSTITDSIEKTKELSRLSGLPIKLLGVTEEVAKTLPENLDTGAEMILKMKLQKKYW